MNANRKFRQIILVEAAIFEMSFSFSEKIENLKHEKQKINPENSEKISSFNKKVADLAEERLKVIFTVKSAEWNLRKLFEEFRILQAHENRDSELISKVEKWAFAAASATDQLSSCDADLQAQRKKIEAWQMKEAQIQSELSVVFEQNPAQAVALSVIFKKNQIEHNSGSEESEDDFEDPDICPPGCDLEIYEEVLRLRSIRFQLADELKSIKMRIESIVATHAQLLLDERTAASELRRAKDEVEAFHLIKQKELNKIDVILVTDASRLLNGEDPELADSVLITREALDKLEGRIGELIFEKKDVLSQYKKIEKDFSRKINEKETAEAELKKLKIEFDQLSILKFGQQVDLNKLETAEITSDSVSAAKSRLEAVRLSLKEKIGDSETAIKQTLAQLNSLTSENTLLIKNLAASGRASLANEIVLEKNLARTVVNDDQPIKDEILKNKNQIRKISRQQQKEIKTLASEIDIFGKSSFWETLNKN